MGARHRIMGVFKELQDRGLVAQCTDFEAVEKLLDTEKVVFYIGFDPTADSLHVGHFLQLVVMSHLQKAGHIPIAVLGDGTGMVGDPSGKSDMRKMMTPETIRHNADCFKSQMRRLVNFSPANDPSDGLALMVNNGDWLLKLNYIDFLRDVGVHFSVNRMLTAECFKSRLERGLSFIEFNYMLMQSYDFMHLNRVYDCRMQLGGDDQWSNIISGVDLTRRMNKKEVYGLTFTLLTTSDGKKMGKTERGAVWLDAEKYAPYDFYQYWRNVADSDVIRCLKLVTFVPLSEISAYEKLEGVELNAAKERLAFEVTRLVHGEEEATRARNAAQAVFGKGAESADMPTTEVALMDGRIGVLDLLVSCGLAPSKGEARRLVQQGGIEINEKKVTDASAFVGAGDFADGSLVIKKGKKTFHRALLG